MPPVILPWITDCEVQFSLHFLRFFRLNSIFISGLMAHPLVYSHILPDRNHNIVIGWSVSSNCQEAHPVWTWQQPVLQKQKLGNESATLLFLPWLNRFLKGLYLVLHQWPQRWRAEDFIRVTRAPGVIGHGGEESADREQMERLLNLGQKHLQQAYKHNKARAMVREFF